jgi:hypothetical protein
MGMADRPVSAGLIQNGLNPGCFARSAEIDYSDGRFVIQGNCVGIDPVANVVAVKQREACIELGDGDHEVRAGDTDCRNAETVLGHFVDRGQVPEQVPKANYRL